MALSLQSLAKVPRVSLFFSSSSSTRLETHSVGSPFCKILSLRRTKPRRLVKAIGAIYIAHLHRLGYSHSYTFSLPLSLSVCVCVRAQLIRNFNPERDIQTVFAASPALAREMFTKVHTQINLSSLFYIPP